MPQMSRYDKKLEIFRSHYFTNTGKKLDDELFYIIIKMREVHADLKKILNSIKFFSPRPGTTFYLDSDRWYQQQLWLA
jgi:hypothetical protein